MAEGITERIIQFKIKTFCEILKDEYFAEFFLRF